ncbi:GNAT family N-acetyltransferase [Ideonella sp.]|uniref:GNAT family N-acetyltransferase n=1 Tax=Ideonella sp. TaxID=1929293 RepID=UPI0035B3E524
MSHPLATRTSAATLQLVAPRAVDLPALLAFELENRAFFEATINARPADYYSAEGVGAAIEQAQREARDDRAYQYLLWDSGALVGRVNLTKVRRAHFHSAEVGYRIAQSAGGRGLASEAVRQVLAKAFGEHGLVRVEATARPENEGSTRVLQKNGFTPFGRSHRSFELAGIWYDLLHFERRAEA